MTCSHALTVDEVRRRASDELVAGHAWEVVDVYRVRRCLLCGVSYDRSAVLERLREGIRTRKTARGVSSPWSAAERAE